MEDRKQEIMNALEAIAERVEILTSLTKKFEEKKYFASCLGSLTDTQGKPQWQLYHSILSIIDLWDLAYVVESFAGDTLKIKIECGKCIFMELVTKEEYDAWLSKRRK